MDPILQSLGRFWWSSGHLICFSWSWIQWNYFWKHMRPTLWWYCNYEEFWCHSSMKIFMKISEDNIIIGLNSWSWWKSSVWNPPTDGWRVLFFNATIAFWVNLKAKIMVILWFHLVHNNQLRLKIIIKWFLNQWLYIWCYMRIYVDCCCVKCHMCVCEIVIQCYEMDATIQK